MPREAQMSARGNAIYGNGCQPPVRPHLTAARVHAMMVIRGGDLPTDCPSVRPSYGRAPASTRGSKPPVASYKAPGLLSKRPFGRHARVLLQTPFVRVMSCPWVISIVYALLSGVMREPLTSIT